MSYNFKRRILRIEKSQFVKEWKQKNKITNKVMGRLLEKDKKKFSLNNQYLKIIEISISAISKKAESLDKE